MNLLPLIERELRVASRRWPTAHQVRMLCGISGIVSAFGILLVWSAWHPTAGFGQPFLQLLATVGYVGSMITGVVLAADTLSREKREGTLDLLFLTDLRIRDVLFGSLVAKAIVPVYGFLAVIPTLQVSVLLGGTTVGECIRLFLVWADSLFFALAVSLVVSASSWRQRTACAGSILLLLALTTAVPAIGSVLAQRMASPLWEWISLSISPRGPYFFNSPKVYAVAWSWFWAGFTVNLALSCLLLGAAYLILIRSRSDRVIKIALGGRGAREMPSRAQAESGSEMSAGGLVEIAIEQAGCTHLQEVATDQPEVAPLKGAATPGDVARRRELLDCRPADWLAARTSRTPFLLWVWAAVTAGFCLNLSIDPFGNAKGVAGFLLLLGFHCVLKLAAASDATYAFTADRRSGALESLLATDVDVQQIAVGVRREFGRRYAGPVLLLSLATLVVAHRLFGQMADPGAGAVALVAVMLPLDVYCLFWIGLFQGLAARNSAVALATCLFEIVLLPWAWLLICGQVFVRNSGPELLVLWVLIVLANHAWFLSNAKSQLWRHFRTLALKPYGEKNPRIESDWSAINWEEEPERRGIGELGS